MNRVQTYTMFQTEKLCKNEKKNLKLSWKDLTDVFSKISVKSSSSAFYTQQFGRDVNTKQYSFSYISTSSQRHFFLTQKANNYIKNLTWQNCLISSHIFEGQCLSQYHLIQIQRKKNLTLLMAKFESPIILKRKLQVQFEKNHTKWSFY